MPALTTTRNSVALVFALNGLLFASLVSRLPDVRASLALDNGALGLLLLAIAAGSMLALPSAGWLIGRSSAATVVRTAAVGCAVGLALSAVTATVAASAGATALGFFVYGLGIGVWDVAMNVEAAGVERLLHRTLMPRFHAGWTIGGIAGAGIGVAMAAGRVPAAVHLGVVCAVSAVLTVWAAGAFLPPAPPAVDPGRHRSAWREPRTLAIGLMVLVFAVTEGSANDWLALALIDGYDARQWVGVAGFALFVCAMTAGRLVGPVALDRFGRRAVLWATTAAAAAGILLVVYGGSPLLVGVGILVWGLGASLGFPVGMSAAADEPAAAAARVSVVSTIGYGAFLAGPPLLGQLGDAVGTLPSLLAVALLMVPAAFAVLAARPPGTAKGPGEEARTSGA